MPDNNNDPLNAAEDSYKERFSDEKTENKIHQHLTNIKDIISDDDIKAVRTDLGVSPDSSPGLSEKELKNAEREEEEKQKDDSDDNPEISSWNILGS